MSTIGIEHGPTTHVATPGGERYDILNLERVKQAHIPFYPNQEDVTADGNTAAAIATLQMWRALS